MRHLSLFIVLAIFLLGSGCKKSAELEAGYIPFFKGNVETIVSLKNLSFAASFEKMDPANAEDCGFEWSKKSGGNTNIIKIGKISTSDFTQQFAVKLDEGTEYQVRAWIQVGSKKFYSWPTNFFGAVAEKPEILSLNRIYALWGDTIRIKARNLTADILASDVSVIIENSYIQPLFVDSTEMVFIMPYSTTIGNLNITFKVNNHRATNSALIENAIPQMASISKEMVRFGDTVTLVGKFEMVRFGDTVTLVGKFWPEYASRAFPVNNYWTQSKFNVVSYSNNKIVIKIPNSEICTQNFDINFLIIPPSGGSEKNINYSGHGFTRTGNWTMLNGTVPANMLVCAVFNGEVFALDRSSNYYDNTPFYKYNPKTNQWITLKSNPSPSYRSQSLVECNGEIYAGLLRNSTQSTNLYKYNIQSNIWIPCAIFPPPSFPVWNMVAFSMQNKIYVFEEGASTKWIYDPINNAWEQAKSNVPGFTLNTRILVFNGDYYFYPGTGNALYQYNIQEDTFTSVPIDGLDGVYVFFNIKDKIYFTKHCSVFELDILNKTSIEKPEFSNYLSDNYNFFFENNNKAYFLTSSNYLYTFTPDN